jgi:AcrR family transcriptional regulator
MPQPTDPADASLPGRGVRQAKQQRSLQKQRALLAAGRDLLKSHDLPALSVAQVAAAGGVAVGSFYARFEDKDAWFAELSRESALTAFAELEQLLASPALHGATAAGKVSLLMHWLVQVHRDHQGIFRAAVSDPARTQLYWTPLMRLCARVDRLVYGLLAPDLHAVPARLTQARVSFAFQMVFSTLVNAVLHDAGPVRLHDPALAPELARSFLASVGFTAPAG